MSNQLVLQLSPEDEELQLKSTELANLEAELVQGELDLATIHAELQNFEREYQQIIGTRYTELDRIEEQIAEYIAYIESSKNFTPSEDIKKLYREVAKCIHPDLTTDPAEKARRQKLMVEANQAYEAGDMEGLRAILYKWESHAESVKGEGVAADLIRVIRKLAQCRERLREIKQEMEAVKDTELYSLKNQADLAKEEGQDLLAVMAQELDEQIKEAQIKLQEIKSQLN
jgi:DnaJ-domain-containing protein 1